MKVSLGQKISLVGLIIGLTVLGLLANPEKIPKAEAASTTAWSITDLDDASITTTRSGFLDGWIYEIENSAGTTVYGDVYDNENAYNDGGTTGSAEAVRLNIYGISEPNPNIQAGDTITLSGDGTPTDLTVYLPALTVNDILWVADDGSTYYDSGLSSLAYEAPITISIALDSTLAYDFGAIIPEQTYTTSNNVRNVTVTCNETNGWKLYIKSTGNFTSGANTININSLEWSWDDAIPGWTDVSTTDTEVRSSSSPTSASGVTTGMEYRLNVDFASTPASNYSATITYTAVTQ